MLKENLGYYISDGVIFDNKIKAILHASKTGNNVEWNYCDSEFSKFNWNEEPELKIDDYYKLRAKQIRENYDYVLLRCSGGADSTNMLYSFLNNNIMPDEIVGESPLDGLKNWNWNNKDSRMINTVSEFKYAQLPLLDNVKINYPQIKVTHIDNFSRIIKPDSYQWLLNCNDGIDAHAGFEGTMLHHKSLKDLAEKGKKIAIVTGTDKPYVSADHLNSVYVHLVDLPLNYLKKPFNESYTNVHRVTFYWTPDYPEIISKMAHIIAKKLFGLKKDFNIFASMIANNNESIINNSNFTPDDILSFMSMPQSRDYIVKKNLSYNPNNVYGRGICKYIYPSTYDPTVFQAEKQDKNVTFFGAQQDWIRILHKDLKGIDMMFNEFSEIYKSINKKFLNKYGTGFVFFRKSYKIGHVNDFANK